MSTGYLLTAIHVIDTLRHAHDVIVAAHTSGTVEACEEAQNPITECQRDVSPNVWRWEGRGCQGQGVMLHVHRIVMHYSFTLCSKSSVDKNWCSSALMLWSDLLLQPSWWLFQRTFSWWSLLGGAAAAVMTIVSEDVRLVVASWWCCCSRRDDCFRGRSAGGHFLVALLQPSLSLPPLQTDTYKRCVNLFKVVLVATSRLVTNAPCLRTCSVRISCFMVVL